MSKRKSLNLILLAHSIVLGKALRPVILINVSSWKTKTWGETAKVRCFLECEANHLSFSCTRTHIHTQIHPSHQENGKHLLSLANTKLKSKRFGDLFNQTACCTGRQRMDQKRESRDKDSQRLTWNWKKSMLIKERCLFHTCYKQKCSGRCEWEPSIITKKRKKHEEKSNNKRNIRGKCFFGMSWRTQRLLAACNKAATFSHKHRNCRSNTDSSSADFLSTTEASQYLQLVN